MQRTTCLARSLFLVCGAIAGALAAGLVPAGLGDLSARQLAKKPFNLLRSIDDLVEVTEGKWFFEPVMFGDFDLQMDVEVSEGVELDLLLRQVEPRLVDGRLLPFAGRFSVLRLSTEGDGVGWRTRDQALLGPKGNGVGIAPGHLATIWVQARGRELTANVAGKAQPTFEADDVYGMTALIVKGGKVVIHRMEITPRGPLSEWSWSRWTWGGIGLLGAALLSLLALRQQSVKRLLWAGATLVSYAWLLARGIDLDLAFPAMAGIGMAVALPLLLSAAVLCMPPNKVKWLLTPLALLAVLVATRQAVAWPGLLRSAVDVVGDGFQSVQGFVEGAARTTDSTEIDAVFGPKAGAQISEAHGLLVRGPTGLADVDRDAPCVFMLGGDLLYNVGMRSDHLALLVEQQLRGMTRKPVEVPSLPTVDGYSSQQWRMFDQFFQAFRPDVVVLGIGPDECAVNEGESEPRSSRTALRDTIRTARKSCEQHGRQLVLFADVGVPSALMLELREQEAAGVPLVVAFEGRARIETARKLAEICQPFLK
ncbi:MAG: hypothetical protein ACI89X_000977 [Planctomycetota bacterium]|jgi:hypothetical protein